MTNPHFLNEQIELNQLPLINHLDFIPLEKDYLKVSMIISAIISFILIAGSIFMFFFLNNGAPKVLKYGLIPFAIGLSSLLIFLTYKSYHYKFYALRDKDIVFKSGYVFRSQTAIPFNRVQHCEVNNGPIDRIFGLSSLKLFTAGGSQSDLRIPGLKNQTANDLKHFIIRKTALKHGEEE